MCIREIGFQKEKKVTFDRLRHPRYREWMLRCAEAKIRDVSQEKLLFNHRGNKNTGHPLPFIFSTPFSKHFHEVKKIINKHPPVLTFDETLAHILEGGVKVVSRRSQMLGEILSPT